MTGFYALEFSSLAEILQMYFREYNPLLHWMLVHWSKLAEQQVALWSLAQKQLFDAKNDTGKISI